MKVKRPTVVIVGTALVVLALLLFAPMSRPRAAALPFLASSTALWQKTGLYTPVSPATPMRVAKQIAAWKWGAPAGSLAASRPLLIGGDRDTIVTTAYRVQMTNREVSQDVEAWSAGLNRKVFTLLGSNSSAEVFGPDVNCRIDWRTSAQVGYCDVWVTDTRPTTLLDRVEAFFHGAYGKP